MALDGHASTVSSSLPEARLPLLGEQPSRLLAAKQAEEYPVEAGHDDVTQISSHHYYGHRARDRREHAIRLLDTLNAPPD